MCHRGVVEIECWSGSDVKRSIVAPTPSAPEVAALRTAIEEVRGGGGADGSVAFDLTSPVGAVVRGAARVVLGAGAVVVTTLLMALVVVGSATRAVLLLVIAAVVVVGGLLVTAVWRTDVRLVLHHDGRLRRAGWGGVTEVDVRAYERVVITPE